VFINVIAHISVPPSQIHRRLGRGQPPVTDGIHPFPDHMSGRPPPGAAVKRPLRRLTVLASATAAALAALISPPAASAAQAADEFADCPSLPADARPLTWKCYVLTAEDTLIGVSLGRMHAHTKEPIRLTVAQGSLTN